MRRACRWQGVFVVVLLMGLAACDQQSDVRDLQDSIQALQAEKPPFVVPAPTFSITAAMPNDLSGVRDPFVPLPLLGNALFRPDKDRPKEPLEEFDLDALRMVGTLFQGKEQSALIAASDGVVYMARVGNHIGKSFGRIDHISRDKMLIREFVSDGMGGWKQRLTTMALEHKT